MLVNMTSYYCGSWRSNQHTAHLLMTNQVEWWSCWLICTINNHRWLNRLMMIIKLVRCDAYSWLIMIITSPSITSKHGGGGSTLTARSCARKCSQKFRWMQILSNQFLNTSQSFAIHRNSWRKRGSIFWHLNNWWGLFFHVWGTNG